MAKIKCDASWSFVDIAKASGSSCVETIFYDGEHLTISDVSFDSLSAAVANYDHDEFVLSQAVLARRESVKTRLLHIDSESVRPMRAKAAGNATSEDEAKLAALDLEAAALRSELKTI